MDSTSEDKLSLLKIQDRSGDENIYPKDYEENEEDSSEIFDSTLEALENPLILKRIFDNLSIPHLLTCRLVSSSWRDISTPTCLHLNTHKLRFKLNNSSTNYVTHVDPSKSLQSLNSCLQQHSTFPWKKKGLPCSHIWFRECDLDHPDIQTCLNLHGSQVKNFHFEPGFKNFPSKLTTFRHLIFNQAPNIEHICLPTSWTYDSPTLLTPLDPSNKQIPRLPNLKSILSNFRSQDSKFLAVLKEILTAAVNLEKCDFDGYYGSGLEIKYLDLFESSGNLKAVKDLLFRPKSENLCLFEKLCSSLDRMRLEKIYIYPKPIYRHPEVWLKTARILSTILNLSSSTLTEFKMFEPTGFLQDVQWPILGEVKKLVFEVNPLLAQDGGGNGEFQPEHNLLFPRGFKFSTTFPNVYKISLYNAPVYNLWTSFLKFVDSAPNVKYLKINDPSSSDVSWIGELAKIFPNLENLFLAAVKNFPCLAREIWKFKQVRVLYLELCVDTPEEEEDGGPQNCFPFLDSCFTGFTTKICKQVQRSRKFEDVEKFRVNPSILDMTELKMLTVTFYTESGTVENSYNLLTDVTGRFAFDLMPSVQVDLSTESEFAMYRTFVGSEWKKKMAHTLRPMAAYANVWTDIRED